MKRKTVTKQEGDSKAGPRRGPIRVGKPPSKTVGIPATGQTTSSSGLDAKSLSGDMQVQIGRETISLTHLSKIYWPDEGYTKGDLVKYYYEISKFIIPHLKDRPLIMKRYPNGIAGPFFHQHGLENRPGYLRTASIDVEEGHAVNYIIGDDLPSLLYMTNLGSIERHPWHSRLQHLDKPDWFVFDLDPPDGVGYKTVCEVALCVRDILECLGLQSWAKTSGSRGMHVYVPIKGDYGYKQVSQFAEKVAILVTLVKPELTTVQRSLKRRSKDAIYVDFMQNSRGKSVVSPYSVRPRVGATVSAPLEWSEVEAKNVTTQDFTIKSMPQRLAKKGDLFNAVLHNRQKLDKAMKEIDRLHGK